METRMTISQNKEFIRYYYNFRLNLQRVKNHHYTKDYRQAQHDAICNFRKLMAIANQEANGNSQLRHDFELWLLWNFELNQEHCNPIMNPELNFDAKTIDALMVGIQQKKETNKINFEKALLEYEHVRGTLTRRIVQKSQAKYVVNFFGSILRKIVAFDTIYMYGFYQHRLQEELNGTIQRMKELNFPELVTDLQVQWQTFKKHVQNTEKLCQLQKEEINTAFKQCELDDKRTFLEQLGNKIGEIYESIREQLRQIRNNAFTIKQAMLYPICSPIESIKNISHVFCHPMQTARVACEWIHDNPGKAAVLFIGIAGISIIIGGAVAVVGTALYTGTSILSFTAADLIIGGALAGSIMTTTTFTAVGGKAARESALQAKSAVKAEIMQRQQSLDELNHEEEQYRQQAREAMREQRRKYEIQRRETSLEVVNTNGTSNSSHYEPSTIESDSDRLNDAVQELQFAKEDVSREQVARYREERTLNKHLEDTIKQYQLLKEAIKQKQNDTIKTTAKQLVSTLNEQDRFDDATKILDALKKQDYDELLSIIGQFSSLNSSFENEVGESTANDTVEAK
ncbi:unnamed protein product [Adineta steineri]|uniref:Uncharacterized protein n=1 Tax=Adineta steineri TaxID=433720 RepID=A0A813WGW3_9BILA|nr:unnamed protein product [Adineta steineri]CAF0861176.1 unnamed protein product [Adineta steineri]